MKGTSVIHGDNPAKVLRNIGFIMLLILILMAIIKPDTALASSMGSQVSVSINYAEETATITAGAGGSTRFFVSTDKGKNWEGIDGNVVDISTMLKPKEVEVWFKGNRDTAENRQILMAEPKDLQVTYEIVNGVGRITFNPPAGTTVEYRKGANGNWRPAYTNMPTSLYELRGTTLYFRTVATVGRRNSKIVQVKISKRPSAPSVKVDGSKLCVSGIKAGVTQYRLDTSSDWITITGDKVKDISLYDLLANKVVSNAALPAGNIEFRNLGSGKKPTSAVKLIEVPQQMTCPETITMNGSTVTIIDTTPKRVYEYTKVERTANFDMAKAKWSSISLKNNSFKIPKVAVGDRILIRVKSSVNSSTKQVNPASTYKEFIIQSLSF
jgi:hypothetical protein